jgi:hypothetical protein
MQLSHFLKSEYRRLTSREILPKSLDCLAGVSKSAAEALAAAQIKTVFDLATSVIFKAAEDALHTSNNGARFLPALVSADLVETTGKTATADEFLNQAVSIFNGVDGNIAQKIETDAGIKFIRDLATWPPYLAAKAILHDAYGLTPPETSDAEYPDDLVPGSGRYPTERVQYEVLVFDRILGYERNNNGVLKLSEVVDEETRALSRSIIPTRAFLAKATAEGGPVNEQIFGRLEEAGPIDVSMAASPDYGFQRPALGALLTYNQSWYTQGLALGQLLHTLALAPGESTRIAMIDWSRRSRAFTGEEISQTEALQSELERGRSIREVTGAVAREAQVGFSKSKTEADSSQFGAAGGAAGLIGPVVVGGGVSHGTASSSASSTSWASSAGVRSLNAEMSQNITDRTQQAASSTRNRRATVVREVSQEESERISTRTVANYNHMHALSIEYFEIVQLYRVAIELARATRCLFIPMKVLTFDPKLARRFRAALAGVGLIPEVRILTAMEPDHVAVVAPHRVKPWPVVSLQQLGIAAGETVGTLEATELILPKGFSKTFTFGFWEEVPIDRIVVTFTSGEASTFNLVNAGDGAVGPRYRPSTGDLFDRYRNGRDFSEIARIELLKKAGSEEYEGDLELTILFSGDSSDFQRLYDMPGAYLHTTIHVPKGAPRFVAFEMTESITDGDLIKHLNDNTLYYSQAVWRSLDSATLALLLSPYTIGDQPVIEVIDPLPIMVAGNYLVFRMYADTDTGEWEVFKAKHQLTEGKVVQEDIVPLPSGGVFAEAVLGRANSAEKIDLTRFWNWQDSPTPLSPPEIAAIQSGSRAQNDNPVPGQLDAPVINIVNPPALSDPTGLSAALQAVQNGAMFRDMSGLAATIGLTQAALSRMADAAGSAAGQAGQNMAIAANLYKALVEAVLGASSPALDGRGKTPPSAPNTVTNQGGVLEQARKLDAQETKSQTQQTGQPVPPVQRRQEEVLRVAEPSALGGGPGGVLGQLLNTVLGAAPIVKTATATRANPNWRACCALGQWLLGASGELDPASLTGHRYGGGTLGGGPVGYIYTARVGLVDVGHVRDTADMTKFVYDALVSGCMRLDLYEGIANVSAIPSDASSILDLAGAIAYVESWAHELQTWDDFSSFSPEDIPSNIIGIELGKRVIKAGGSYDTAVDTALDTLINNELKARPKTDTKTVLAKIKNKWFKPTPMPPFLELLRRNFNGIPWMIGMAYDAPMSLPWLSPAVFEASYAMFTYEIKSEVDGKAGVTLATMKATTKTIRDAFVANNPGMDEPGI